MATGEFGANDIRVGTEDGDGVRVEVEAGCDSGEVVDHNGDGARVRHLIQHNVLVMKGDGIAC